MQVTPLSIDGAWRIEPEQHSDERGVFLEWFRQDVLARQVGHPLDLQQANWSTSAAGVVRGVHFADLPPSQAKYVTCVSGAAVDVAVDVRVGSPTYGTWEAVRLDDENRNAVYLAEGLGHAFMALAPRTTVVYLCSASYAPGREHGINPLDPGLGIDWPTHGRDGGDLTPALSPKDQEAPTLVEAEQAGMLPTFADAQAFYSGLRAY